MRLKFSLLLLSLSIAYAKKSEHQCRMSWCDIKCGDAPPTGLSAIDLDKFNSIVDIDCKYNSNEKYAPKCGSKPPEGLTTDQESQWLIEAQAACDKENVKCGDKPDSKLSPEEAAKFLLEEQAACDKEKEIKCNQPVPQGLTPEEEAAFRVKVAAACEAKPRRVDLVPLHHSDQVAKVSASSSVETRQVQRNPKSVSYERIQMKVTADDCEMPHHLSHRAKAQWLIENEARCADRFQLDDKTIKLDRKTKPNRSANSDSKSSSSSDTRSSEEAKPHHPKYPKLPFQCDHNPPEGLTPAELTNWFIDKEKYCDDICKQEMPEGLSTDEEVEWNLRKQRECNTDAKKPTDCDALPPLGLTAEEESAWRLEQALKCESPPERSEKTFSCDDKPPEGLSESEISSFLIEQAKQCQTTDFCQQKMPEGLSVDKETAWKIQWEAECNKQEPARPFDCDAQPPLGQTPEEEAKWLLNKAQHCPDPAEPEEQIENEDKCGDNPPSDLSPAEQAIWLTEQAARCDQPDFCQQQMPKGLSVQAETEWKLKRAAECEDSETKATKKPIDCDSPPPLGLSPADEARYRMSQALFCPTKPNIKPKCGQKPPSNLSPEEEAAWLTEQASLCAKEDFCNEKIPEGLSGKDELKWRLRKTFECEEKPGEDQPNKPFDCDQSPPLGMTAEEEAKWRMDQALHCPIPESDKKPKVPNCDEFPPQDLSPEEQAAWLTQQAVLCAKPDICVQKMPVGLSERDEIAWKLEYAAKCGKDDSKDPRWIRFLKKVECGDKLPRNITEEMERQFKAAEAAACIKSSGSSSSSESGEVIGAVKCGDKAPAKMPEHEKRIFEKAVEKACQLASKPKHHDGVDKFADIIKNVECNDKPREWFSDEQREQFFAATLIACESHVKRIFPRLSEEDFVQLLADLHCGDVMLKGPRFTEEQKDRYKQAMIDACEAKYAKIDCDESAKLNIADPIEAKVYREAMLRACATDDSTAGFQLVECDIPMPQDLNARQEAVFKIAQANACSKQPASVSIDLKHVQCGDKVPKSYTEEEKKQFIRVRKIACKLEKLNFTLEDAEKTSFLIDCEKVRGSGAGAQNLNHKLMKCIKNLQKLACENSKESRISLVHSEKIGPSIIY